MAQYSIGADKHEFAQNHQDSFSTDEAVFKLSYLALNNISQKWTMLIRDWKVALNRFTIQFGERMSRV